jgi:hypothetical protein
MVRYFSCSGCSSTFVTSVAIVASAVSNAAGSGHSVRSRRMKARGSAMVDDFAGTKRTGERGVEKHPHRSDSHKREVSDFCAAILSIALIIVLLRIILFSR